MSFETTHKSDWQRAYPYKSRYFARPAWRMHYVDEGAGDPIVMVHGNPTWSFYYRALIDAFRPTHRCIAMDHIGCGLSDRPTLDAYDYQLKSRIDDLEALLDHLGLQDNVTMVVHDWGGMIGLGAALRKPERIARYVILNTAAFLLPEGVPFPWQLHICRRDSAFVRTLVRSCNLFCWGAAIGGTGRGLGKAARRGLMAPYDSYANRLAVHEFVKDIPLTPSHVSYQTALEIDNGLVETVGDKPMQICWGLQDFVFDGQFLAEWQRRFPNATVEAYSDAGHYVLEDVPERVIRAMQQMLKTVP